MGNTERRALEPALIQLGEHEGPDDRLLGNVCEACNLVFFPARRYCSKCCERLGESKPLSRRGRLVSFTIISRKPRNAAVEPPYVMGEVELEEGGAHIISVIRALPEALRTGTELEMALEKVREDEEGNAVVAYSFVPV